MGIPSTTAISLIAAEDDFYRFQNVRLANILETDQSSLSSQASGLTAVYLTSSGQLRMRRQRPWRIQYGQT